MTPLNRGRVQKENWHIVISTYGVLSRLKASPSPTALITAVDDQGAGLCLVEANLYSTSCTMECFVVASSVVSYAS